MTQKELLVQRLAALLGFEDGAADVLEHLLSIESSDDLVDYLSQLLGRNDDKLQSFAQDVGKFHQGEPLVSNEHVADDVKLPARPERTYYNDATRPKLASSNRRNEGTGENSSKQTSKTPSALKVASNPSPKKATASVISPPASSIGQVKSSTSATVPTRNEEALLPPPASPPPPKSHPPKGTASVVCGCFGSVHKPLTNCLYCGRISCEWEGYDYCPFCGLLVEQVSGENDSSTAWQHKERLLRFDRDFARRMVVLDDQADYFTSNQTWLTDEEKADAEEKEAKQQEKLKRGKQILDIAF